MTTDYEDVLHDCAKVLLFTNLPPNLPDLGLAFRKGKTNDDIAKAISKAYKNGQQKTEFELNMLKVYLKDVLKLAPKVKQ
jgi:hypothetical protein